MHVIFSCTNSVVLACHRGVIVTTPLLDVLYLFVRVCELLNIGVAALLKLIPVSKRYFHPLANVDIFLIPQNMSEWCDVLCRSQGISS